MYKSFFARDENGLLVYTDNPELEFDKVDGPEKYNLKTEYIYRVNSSTLDLCDESGYLYDLMKYITGDIFFCDLEEDLQLIILL